MKYLLKKDLPLAEIGEEVSVYTWYEWWECLVITPKWKTIIRMKESDIQEWLEPIVEKKTYDDLKEGDTIFWIWKWSWYVCEWKLIDTDEPRSEVFLTREEAEDEHARREFAVRNDRFIPKGGELYYYPSSEWEVLSSNNDLYPFDYIMINAWLSFRTRQACQDAIDNNDILRLFYTIR